MKESYSYFFFIAIFCQTNCINMILYLIMVTKKSQQEYSLSVIKPITNTVNVSSLDVE